MWGGNIFGLTNCMDLDEGEEDAAENTCTDYPLQHYCGNYDDDDFIAGDLCCICGGGTEADTVVVVWENPESGPNVATTFSMGATGEIDDLGDRDTYVIYPT